MVKCLVLGANGFIGSHLVDSLVDRGHSVRAFDRFSSGEPKFIENELVEVFAGNYLNRDDLRRAIEGVEYVFHFISTTTPATAENDPVIDIETNVKMSVELFKFCIEAGVKRILFASSGGSIYGLSDRSLAHRETDPTLPISPYAIGKLSVENYLRYFSKKFGIDYTVYRMSNPYGERQPLRRKQGVIPIFLEQVHDGLPLTVYGDGLMIRDYIHVRDVAEMIAGTFDRPHREPVYNIGSGTGNTLNEIIDCIERVTGKEVVIEYKSVPSTFVDKVILDMTRFQSEFNIEPKIKLIDGIQLTYDHIIEMEKEEL